MSDFDSSLPIRTENAGDVIAKIADSTTPSQQLTVNADGSINITDNGGSITVDGTVTVTATDLDIRNLSAAQDNVAISDGSDTLAINADGSVNITDNGGSLTVDGTVTANQGTSPWITKDQADGPVTPGTVASFSQLAGGQFNSTPPTVTDGQQVALQVDSSGKLLVSSASADDHNYGTVGANTLRTASQIGNATGAADFNFGSVGAQTLRTAAEVGNSTGAADFNNGATGAQTLRVAANIAVGGANVTASNPVPVTIETAPGTHINDLKDATTIAAAASDNHDYTVTAGKTLHLNQVESSASGKAKMEVQIETGVATNTFTSKFVQFNSTSSPNMSIHIDNDISVAAGVRVRVIMTNRDNQTQDLYSTICGYEI